MSAPVVAAATSSPSPTTPAITSATASSDAELSEAVSHFPQLNEYPPNSLIFTRASGGVNNRCTFISTPNNGPEYVLRIYNNGNNNARVKYEHTVLQLLNQQNQEQQQKFTFHIPVPLPVTGNDNTTPAAGSPHATFVLLKSGASACLFPRIRGTVADASSGLAQAIGQATAELVRGMSQLKVDLPLPNPLYRNMYDAHHFITRETFYELIRGERCNHVREAANELLEELEKIETLISKILAMSPPLPQQQIHADCHTANILVHEGKVSAILDFEFTAPDWTAMELVVGLSKYIATSDAEAAFAAWVNGYAIGGGTLTQTEANLIPELIVLRVLNNVIYFAGRSLAGEDDLDALTSRMVMYNDRCKWIRERAPWMRQVLTKALVKETAQAAQEKQ